MEDFEKQIKVNFEHAWIQLLYEKFNENNLESIEYFISLLEEILQRLYSLIPNRVDLHYRIHDAVPPDLIKQMLVNKAMSNDDFRKYFTEILNWIKMLGAPNDDKDVNNTIETLQTMEIENFADTVPNILYTIHKHLDIVDERKKDINMYMDSLEETDE